MIQLMHSFVGHTAPPEILKAVRQGQISAFCLFAANNVESPAQLRELTDSLRRAAEEGGHPAPLIGIDQEGGQLIAVTGGATELPGNMALGATRSPELAEKAGYVLGRELLAMGINLNFAPSVDVNVNPENPVIGIRSFGDDPKLVADLGVALIRGIQSARALATAKHFPGHGDTAQDSHDDLFIVPHSMERMEAVELYPFREAIKANVAAIMTAHLMFPALDSEHPATLSTKALNQLLRRELGFNGLIITDAMDMHAIAQFGHLESVERAISAGADLVMLGHIEDQLGLMEQLQSAPDQKAAARIQAARARVPTILPPADVIGCWEHQKIAQDIADASITMVRRNGNLPLAGKLDKQVAVITPRPVDLTPADTSSFVKIKLVEAIRKRHPNVMGLEMPFGSDSNYVTSIVEATKDADIIVVGTISADRDPCQVELVQELYRRGKSLIVVALRTPYDLAHFPMVHTYLCSYGIREASMEAVARVLFGEIEATGTLPCALPDQLMAV